jgi:hypothetical protein
MTLVVSLLAAHGAYAQNKNPDITSEAFMRAALTVMTFDYFATKCKQGGNFVPGDAAKVEAWQNANGVAQIRLRLRDLDRHPTQKQQLDQALAEITKRIAGQRVNIDACAAAVSVSKLPDAQFAKVSPEILAPVSSPPKTRQEVVRPPSSTTAIAPSETDTKIVTQIDSFGFNSRTKVGIGGFLTVDIYPVVLFRNGDALTNVKGLSFSGGLAAHKRAKPNEWTRWRSQGGKLQLAQKNGWKDLPFQTKYSKLPDNFRLDGFFRSLSGTGTVAVGGSQSVTAWQDYRFSSDGRVVRGNGVGGRSESGDSSITTNNVAPNRRGRYRVQGLMLYITYDDGSEERRILITDPKNPKSAIWLDGIGYARRKP